MSIDSDRAEKVALELFTTAEGRAYPYPLYHQLREAAPVHHSPALGMWILTSYDGIQTMLRDPRFGKNYDRQMTTLIGPDWREHSAATRLEHSMLNVDGAEHTRLRRLAVAPFKKRPIDNLRPLIQQTVDALVKPFAEAGGGDLMEAVAFPLPVTVIGHMLGVPEPDRAQFRQLVSDLVAVFEVNPSAEAVAKADTASDTIRAYFDDLIAEKRRRPQDDILSHLATSEEGEKLSHDELATLASLLFGAGFETTTNLVGNGMWGLLQNPDQIELLRRQPELWETMADEMLRYDGTAQMLARYTVADVEVEDVAIPAGESVFAMLGAGNHDPAEFPDPDAIDFERPRFRPLSLGGGHHFCMGAQLAKAEIEITFKAIVDHCGSMELVGEPPQFRDRLTLRGMQTLELACKPGQAQTSTPIPTPRPRAEAPVQARPARETAPEPRRVRPRAGDAGDATWRRALRAKVEQDADTPRAWIRTPEDLADTIVLLARAELFRSCTPAEIAELAATAYPLCFDPGEALCIEGAESNESYVISEGEVVVTIGDEEVARSGENDVVGERGPLEDRARSASVVATTHVNTWAISRERLLALVEKSPTAREGMLAYVRERYGD